MAGRERDKKPKRGARLWTDPAELEALINEYFDTRIVEGMPPRPATTTGLARRLGITRKTLINYAHRDEFTLVLQRARDRIEEFAEEALFYSQSNRGARFSLEVNFGWSDRHLEGETTEGLTMKQIAPDPQKLAIVKFEEEDNPPD